jgi:hypothetical protein
VAELLEEIHTVSTIHFLYTVKEKGGNPDKKKPYPLPYVLRNPYRNLKSENSQETKKPQQNCTFMNSASGQDEDPDSD